MLQQRGFLDRTLAILAIFLIVYTGYSLLPFLSTVGVILGKILFPFIISLIFYYLLRPIVRILNKKMPASVSILLTFCAVAVFFAFVGVFIFPTVMKQINTLVNLPLDYAEKLKEKNIFKFFNYNIQISNELRLAIINVILNINTVIMKNIVAVIGWITEFIMGLVVVPFILFYLLKDDQQIYNGLCKMVSDKYIKNFKSCMKEIDLTLTHFINGRLLVSAILSLLLLITFIAIQIDYPILLFLFSLLFFIVPTIGAFVATILPLFVGFSMSTEMGIDVLIIMLVASTIEGVLLTPRILGSALYVHPLTIVLLLWIAGLLFGVLGLIVAIPVYALLKVIYNHYTVTD